MIYADDVDAVVKALKLQPTDAGTNVMLLGGRPRNIREASQSRTRVIDPLCVAAREVLFEALEGLGSNGTPSKAG